MQAVVSKLRPNLQKKWRDQAVKRKRTNRASTFSVLAEFVEPASESANDPVFSKEALQSRENAKAERGKGNTKNSLQPKHKGNSFDTNLSKPASSQVSHGAGSSDRSSNRPLCQFCNRPHDLDDCEQFSKETAEQRRAFLRGKQMCFGCYGRNHLSKNCLNKRRRRHVDDCLKSANDEKTAIELIRGLSQACHKGGFKLTKFISNSRAVLESVPMDHRSKEAIRILTWTDCPSSEPLGLSGVWSLMSLGFASL